MFSIGYLTEKDIENKDIVTHYDAAGEEYPVFGQYLKTMGYKSILPKLIFKELKVCKFTHNI